MLVTQCEAQASVLNEAGATFFGSKEIYYSSADIKCTARDNNVIIVITDDEMMTPSRSLHGTDPDYTGAGPGLVDGLNRHYFCL